MGLLAPLFLFSSSAFAVDTVTGNFASPSGVVFDSGGVDRGRAVAVDPSSNVFVAGKKPQAGGGVDWVIMKLDPAGVLLSSAAFDSGASTFDEPMDGFVGGDSFLVAGGQQGSRRLQLFSTATLQQTPPFIGYADGQPGRFTAAIASAPDGSRIITASVVSGQMLINEFAMPGFTVVSTRVVPGVYDADRHGRSLARDPNTGRIFAVAIDSTTGGMRIEELGVNLALLGATNFFKPEPFYGGAALAWSGSGLYAVGVASGGANSVTYVFRLSGLNLVAVTTITASGFLSAIDERVVVIDPTNQDVFVGGSGPFPGLYKFSSDLAGNVQKTLFPTSSMFVQNAQNIFAIEVNQTGPQDIQIHKKDFNLLSGGGGASHGVNELASDGTYIYMGRTDSDNPGIAEIFKISPPNTLVASGTISGITPDKDIKLAYAGASLYVVGSASGPTTSKADAAVWKIDPATILMVSSSTLDSTTGLGDDVVQGATVAPNGDLFLTGAVQNSATTYLAAVWSYGAVSGALTLLAAQNAPGANVDVLDAVASTGSAVYWMIGYSSFTADPGRDKMGLSLWRYAAGALQLVSNRSGYGDSLDFRSGITASATELFVAAERRNSASNLDLAFLKYDLTGSTVVESFWHTESPFKHEIAGGIVLDASGNPLIAGGTEDLATSTGASAYWSYAAANGALSAGFPKTLGNGRLYKPVRHGNDVYGSIFTSSTPILLTGGTSIAGATGLQGAAAPLSFTFSGGPNTALKINSNSNQNEVAQFVFVDTNTGNFYLTWKSTTVSFGTEPDVTSLGKFDASGTMLASTTLLGDRSGGAAVYDSGAIYIQERSDDYSILQITKFDSNLGRLFSRALSSTVVGNVTNAAAFNGNIYAACDGAGAGAADIGAMKVFKFDANLNELARSSYSNVASGFHHNNDALALNAIGDVFVAVSTSESGPVSHFVKYDANLVQLSSAEVTAHFPDSRAQLGYGGGMLYALGNTNPAVAQKMFVRKFGTNLAYQGVSTTITVTGATPNGRLTTDPANNAVVTLTSSTADGGDFISFRFNNELVQLSSGQFDGGFGAADSGMNGVAVDTTSVYLTGAGTNGGHTDAVVLKRSLPAAAPPAAPTRIWAGTAFGAASVGSNWVGGVAPASGDNVVFGSTNPANSCNWNLALTLNSLRFEGDYRAGVDLASAVTVSNAFEMVGDTNAIVRFLDDTANLHQLNGPVTVSSGIFHIGQTTVVAVGSITVNSGGVAEMHDLALFKGVKLHVTQGTGRLKLYDNSGGVTGGPTLTSTGTAAGAVLKLMVDGVVDISSGVFQRLSVDGLQIGNAANIVSLSSVTFAGPLPAGATAINFDLASTLAVATMTNVAFNAANIAVNVNGANLTASSRISMRKASGPKAGPSFENDPGNYIDWYDTVVAGGQPTLSFSGNFNTGARINSSGNGSESAEGVVVDTATGGGPFYYALVHSTTNLTIDPPDTSYLIKYDAAGGMLASATLQGTHTGHVLAIDGNQDLYVAEDTQPSTRRLAKYSRDLVRLASAPVDANAVDSVRRGVTGGGFLYTANEGAPGNLGLIVIKYDAGLNEVARSTYTGLGAGQSHRIDGLVFSPGQNLYVSVADTQTVKTIHVVKYNASLVQQTSANVSALTPSNVELAYNSGKLYLLGHTVSGPLDFYVRRLNASTLAYDGVSSTIAAPGSPQEGVIQTASSTVVVLITSNTADGGDFHARRYDADLVLLSSGNFDGGLSAPDQAIGMAADSSTVVMAGAVLSGGHYDAVTLRRALPAVPAAAPPVVSSVTLAFSGTFQTGARAANDAGGADISRGLAFLSVGPSTFVYAAVHSTSAASPGQTPDQATLVKFDLTGVVLASATLLGNHSGDVLVAEGGFLYVSEKDSPGTMRRLVKYDANLNRLNSVPVDADAVGNITDGFGRGGFLYTINDGGNASPGAKIIKYDLGLNEIKRATYSFGADHANGNSVIVTPNGEVFVQVFSSVTTKFVKYDANLNPLVEANVSALFPANAENSDLAFANGVLLAASFDAAGTSLLVRKFDPALNYSGASSTFAVQTAPDFGLKAGPDGLFYVALTSYSADGGNYALKVLDPDLVVKGSTSFDAGFAGFDQAVGVAVLDSSNVFVTGAGLNAGQYDAVTWVKNLSAAGGGAGGPAGAPGGFWGLANKDGRIWAAQRGLGVVRRYDFPAPPVSRTSPFAAELAGPNGVVRPTAVGVDGGGNLWVSVSTSPGADGNTRLVRYASSGSFGGVAPSTSNVLSSLLTDVHAVAFRDNGDMWVAQGGGNPSIVTFLRDGASTVGAPTFSNGGASTFTTTAALPIAEALAFDSAGNLWVTGRTLGQIRKYPLSGGSISATPAVTITAISTPGAIAFDASGNMFIGETNETTQFTGKLWKFRNDGTAAAPVISTIPALVQTGVDPTALAFISGQLWGSSDLNDQLVTHPTDPPPPPPQFGTAKGTLYYNGPRTGGTLKVAFSTNPFKVNMTDPATLFASTQGFGSFSIATLRAPNTFYVTTFLDLDNNGNVDGVEPLGYRGASTATLGARTGFYVGVDQTVTGIDARLWDRVAVTGTVTNLSAQSGSVLLQTWIGVPNDADPRGRTDFHDTLPMGATLYALHTATMTNLHIRAFIDQNNSNEYEAGEDNVVLGPIDLSAKLADSTTTVNIAIGSSPAGAMFFNAASISGANIPTNGEAAFLRLDVWSAGGNVPWTGLRVQLTGDAPAPNAFAKVYQDANGNGTFEPGADFVVGDKSFSGTPPSASMTFFSTETVSGSTATYFVGLGFNGLPAGKSAGVALDAASAFKFSAGGLAAGQGPFPVESALALTQFSLAARPSEAGYPVPTGGANPAGGFDTGLYVNVGQRLEVNASGVWNTGALGTTGPGGLSGQTSTSAPAGSVALGALIGRVGGSAWFKVGTSTDFVSGQSGSLALAMNDADYNDNGGSLAVDFRIVPSTTTRVWLGTSGFGQGADIAQNWQGGVVPQTGESVEFDGAVSNADCEWNLYYANVNRFTLKTGYTGRVRLRGSNNPGDFNQLSVDSHAVVNGGTLDLGQNQTLFVTGAVQVRAKLDMGLGGSALGAGKEVVVKQGGSFRYTGTGIARVFPTGFESLGFDVLDGAVEVRGNGTSTLLRFERPTGVLFSASADIRAFSGVQFDQFDAAGSTSALVLVRSTAGVYEFAALDFLGNFSKNIDASGAVAGNVVTLRDSLGPKRGSPFELDPNNVLNWVPDGGGAPASIAGSVLDGGVIIAGATVVVRASTQSFFDANLLAGGPGGAAGGAQLVFITTRNSFGAYTLSGLQAPATYFLYAHRESIPMNPNDFPDGGEPRGAFGKPGLLRSDPIFVGSGQSLTGKDITIKDWFESTGTVTNASSQFGSVLVASALDVSTATFESILGFPVLGPSFTPLGAPATSIVLVGWVDVNNNRQKDSFEASGTFGPFVPPISTAALTLGGGSAPPGGTLSLTPSVAHPGILGDNGPQALLRLDVVGAGSPAILAGLKLDYLGGPPGFGLSVWADGNGNGRLDALGGPTGGSSDFFIGSTQAAGGSASALVNFFNRQTVNAGSTTTLFVAFEPSGLVAGHAKLPGLSVSIGASNYFLLDAGQMAAQGVYPVQTAAPIGWNVFATTQGDSFGGGGYFTGVDAAAGQTVTVTATGSWRFNGQNTDYRGLAGTEGQPTLDRGSRVGAALVSVGNGWVAIGTGVTVTAPFQTGVHLSANDVPGDYFNNDGQVAVDIGISGSTTSRVEGTIAYLGGLTGNLFVNLTQDCSSAPAGCKPILSTQTLTLAGGTTLYAYGLHIPFGGSFSVRAFAQNDPSHRSGFVPNFQAPLGGTRTLNFAVSSGLGTITSTIAYSGVLNFGDFRVGVTTSPDLEHGAEFFGGAERPSTGPIVITDLPIPNTFYMVGFRDGNFNNEPDGPEPFGAIASIPSAELVLSELDTVLLPIYVPSTATVQAPAITLADRGGLSGRLFFSQAVASGEAVIAAAHGVPGSPGFVFENGDFRHVENVAAGGSVDYFLGLLKPATDYTLFAFLDQNGSGTHDGAEPFGTSAGFLTVPAGGFANKDVTIGAPAVPPAVTGFGIVNFGTNFVEFRWDSAPGATGYLLLDASSATVMALGAAATVYNETMTPASTSAVTGIRAVNAQGPGPIVRLPAGMSNAAAAVPAAAPVLSDVAVSSLTVTWTSGGNGSLAKYQLERATVAAGPYQILQYGPSLSRNETGLAPTTEYFYRVKAQSPNGGFAAPSATASATTLASSDSHLKGTVQYDGKQAGGVVVQLFTSSNPLSGLSGGVTLPPSAQQPYYIAVAAGNYFRRAFIDVNGNGLRESGEDQSPISLVAASVTPGFSNFGVDVDTVTPGSPAGLRATTPFGRVELTWNAPASNSNGTPLTDLAGFRVQRTTAGPLNFITLTAGSNLGVPNVTANAFFTDNAPVNSGTDNIYRVIAVDLGRNASIPSGALAVKPALGGTISGSVSSFTVTTSGAFRVRLSTSPRREDPFLSESTLQSFSFSGLADGTYHLRGFRDVNADNAQDAATEPSGTHGGLVAPFPISIVNGNAVTGRTVTVCDRVALTLAKDATGFLAAGDCPALDKGQGFLTDLHTFRVGGGAAGSIGLGASVDVSLITNGFDGELIVLGPDGQIVARDNTPGNPHVQFPASQAGIYVVEPTSFFAGGAGFYDLLLNVFGGFQGTISGETAYSGSQTGPVRLQLFDRPDQNSFPFFVQDQAAPGAFTLGNLRDGTVYLRAFRDVNGNFAKDPGEPSGAFGFSESSPTAITVTGGVPSVSFARIDLSDPSTGRIEGQILRQGSLTGTIRIEVGERECANCGDLNVVAFATIAAAGPYALDFIPPSTSYVLQAFVDGNANNRGDALEAKGSSSPVTVEARSTSTVNILVRDPGTGSAGSSVITGTVSYSGSSTGTVFIGFATDQNFNYIPYFLTQAATGAFSKSGLQGGTSYFVGAFIDVNANGTIDEDGATVEPVGDFDGAVFVPNSSSVGVAFTISDPSDGRLSGVVTYSGSISGPLVVQAQLEGSSGGEGHGNFRSVSIPRTLGVSSYAYTAGFLDAGSFRLYAFVDSNGNQDSDFGEPFFRRESLVTVSSGTGGAPVTGINLLVLDAGAGGASGDVGTISGSLTYLGTQPGPVVVQLFSTNTFVGIPLKTVTASGGPGTFQFSAGNLAEGTYFLRAFKDSNADQALQPQFEAFGLVNGGAGIAVTADAPFTSGHAGTLTDAGEGGPGGGASLAGEVHYRGAFTTGTYVLGLFRDSDNDGQADDLLRRATVPFSVSPATFAFAALPTGQVFLRGFLDRNGNGFPDAHEPFGVADSQGISVFEAVSGIILPVCDRSPLDLTPGAANLHALNGGSCFSRESTTLGASNKLLTFAGTRGQAFDATAASAEDNYLYLYDQQGLLVAEADAGGAKAGDARLTVSLPNSGVYTLSAGFFAAGVSGDINVTSQRSAGAPGSLAGEVRYTGSQGGRILTAIFNSPDFDAPGSFVDFRELVGPGPFSYGGLASETSYYMGAFVDVNFNHQPDAGEDFGVFSTAPPSASPIFLRSGQDLSGLLLEIAASTAAFAGNEGSVTGQVSYPGALTGTLRIEFWTDATFSGAPLAVRSVPTGVGPYDLSIPGGRPYVVRGFLDLNGDFLPGSDEPQGLYAPGGAGAEPVFVPSSGTVSGVDFTLREPGVRFGQTEPSGEGDVAIAPATLAAGTIVNAVTFTYVAEGRGIREGGVVVFGVPHGFPFPQTQSGAAFGYVSTATVTNPGGVAPTVLVSIPGDAPAFELKVLGSTPLYAGATVQLAYGPLPVPCFAEGLRFFTGSASTGTVPPSALLSGVPGVALGAGTAFSARPVQPKVGLLQDTTSQRLLIEALDSCQNVVAVGAGANVVLRAKSFNYQTGAYDAVSGLRLSSATTGVFDSTAVVSFLAGRSSTSYRAYGAAGGDYQIELAANFSGAGATTYANVNVFFDNSLSSVSVSTVPFQLGRTSATLAPGDAAGANQVFINFNLGDPTRFWTVAVASNPFKQDSAPEPLAFFSGQGQPARGQIAWDGRDFRGARVPSGAYYVRVEVDGLRNDDLRVTVNVSTMGLKAFAAAGAAQTNLSDVAIEVHGGLGGGEFATDGSGEATLIGAGSYNLRFQKEGYLEGRAQATLTALTSTASYISTMTAANSNIALSSAGTRLLVQMRPAVRLTVVPSIAVNSTAPYLLWGSLRLENTTANFLLNGPMRLPAGATTFDDGGQWDPSLNQFVVGTRLVFDLAPGSYTVRASLPGFDELTASVFVAAETQPTLTLDPFSKRSAFTGLVFLPAGNNTEGTFVSVSAVPLTTTTAAEGGFGGVFVPALVNTATYRVEGLRPGSYSLRANTQGLKAVSIASATLTAGADTVVDFSSFPVANTSVITATVGVTGFAGHTFPELEPGGPGIRLNISAWAPNSPNGFYDNIAVATSGAGGVNIASQTVVVNMTGLDEGVEYQVFAGLDNRNGDFEAPGGFPKRVTISTVTGRAALAFDFAAASGVIRGTIYIPGTDFSNVELFGETVASAKPDQVGHAFRERVQDLPGIVCGNGASTSPAGNCTVNVASFTVTGLNTETNDITLTYKTSGRTLRTRLSVVNGSTTTFLADLRDPTFKITGQVANQVTDSLFNTNQLIVVNAASVPVRDAAGSKVDIDTATVDLGGVGSVDSLARVLAIRQQFGVSASTNFNPATDRVGYLTTAGTYTIRNLTPGVYLLRTADIRACATCQVVIPRRAQTVSVTDADVAASSFTLSDGFSVEGLISLKAGVQDTATFRLILRNRRLEVVRSTTVFLGNAAAGVAAGSVTYRLDGVPAGEFYSLGVEDTAATPRYIGKPVSFPDPSQSPNGLAANQTGRDVLMRRAAYLTGKLKDAASGEVFNEFNAKVLPPNLRIIAVANPWVEGGFAQAASSVSNRPIRADGTFLVGPLLPETPYDLKVFQDKWDLAFLAQGAQNYAPVGVAGLEMQPLEVRDVGTLSLNQGTSIKGTLVDAASTTTALGNIRVAGKPSFGDVELNVETYSNPLGEFTLWVSTFVSAQYDLTVAPRDGNLAANNKRYRTVELPGLKVSTNPVLIELAELAAAVTGQVFTADGGALLYPFDGEDFPAAAVFLQPAGVNPEENPLGDIAVVSESDGKFTVPALSSGVYVIRAVSLGYGVAVGSVTVTQTSFCISTPTLTTGCQAGLTLKRGGVVKGGIKFSDGSAPSVDDIGGVAAANDDFSKFVTGTIESNDANRTVSGYSITGFEPGVVYNIVLLPPSREDADVVYPTEGQGVSFTAAESTTTKTINLTYARVAPDCEATAVEKAVGNGQFQVKITCTEPLRNTAASDNDLGSILSVSSCVVNGSVKTAANDCGKLLGGDKKIESSRKQITAVYRTGNDNEESFTLKLAAVMATEGSDGENFTLSKLFTFDTIFRAGTNGTAAAGSVAAVSSSVEDRIVVANADEQVSNVRGGSVKLQGSERDADGEQFALNFGEGSFEDCDAGDTTAMNCSGDVPSAEKNKVKVVVKGSLGATDAAARTAATLGYVPSRIQAMVARAGSAYRPQAESSKNNTFGKSPLSTFYDIFLPLGIRSQLSKPVDLTLPYDLSLASNTSVSDLQIWSKSIGNIGKAGCTGQFCPEKENTRVDTVNKTVTVSVNHFSQFVVLNGPPALSGSATFKEEKAIAFNFPNPFDCRTRTVSCNQAEGSCAGGAVTGVGTMIHYAAPGTAASLDHRFRIYNVAGELVDEFHKTAAAGTHHYDFWDCTNSSGRPVASGVYILEYHVNGQSVYHKMAVIKGSGL